MKTLIPCTGYTVLIRNPKSGDSWRPVVALSPDGPFGEYVAAWLDYKGRIISVADLNPGETAIVYAIEGAA